MWPVVTRVCRRSGDFATPGTLTRVDETTHLPRVGMVGGGQLARMTHQAAIALGQSLAVFAAAPTDSAALVAQDVTVGMPDDLLALRAFAARCDVVTFDHEQVPSENIAALVAAGVNVFPPPEALIFAQDKAQMRQRLAALGLPVPAFVLCHGADVQAAAAAFAQRHGGWPLVVKTARGGYDGHGVWMADSAQDLPDFPPELPLVIESRAPLMRELAAVVARSPFGQAAAWPVVETVQRDGICVEVIAPAPDLSAQMAATASDMALRIADQLGVVGVLAVELFQVPISEVAPDGLLINELAMRPHNSGHWSIDGAVTSQFEQHLRAVLDYPLGSTQLRSPVVVMTNVLGAIAPGEAIGMDERVHHLAARFPEIKIHLYGKSFRVGRKLGHVTICGENLKPLRERAQLAAHYLASGSWLDGYQVHGDDERQVVLRADGFTGSHERTCH